MLNGSNSDNISNPASSICPTTNVLAVVLCDVHGYAYEEIVDITGWPMGTVKSRISRGRIKLQEYLLRQPELLPMAFRPKGG